MKLELEGERGGGSPRQWVALVSMRVWRSIDEVLRVKRKFRQGVGLLGLVGTVVGPKALPSRRASPGSMGEPVPELSL